MRRRHAGFSLLEVMVSLAILSLSLVVLIEIVTRNVRAAAHARQVTTATLLARAKMAALEDKILEEGFVDNDQEEEGDFADEGHASFRWQTVIEAVELPMDAATQAQEAMGQAQQDTSGASANPMMALTGMLGGFMSTLIEPIRVGLEQAVRRVTVRVFWQEVGRGEQTFEVVAYLTDPGKLDLALPQMGGPGGAQGQGQQGSGAGAPGGGRGGGGQEQGMGGGQRAPGGGGR